MEIGANSKNTSFISRKWQCKTKLFCFILLFCLCFTNLSAQHEYTLTGRVDTTQAETLEVLELWTNYLYSTPDSVYANPYWNDEERLRFLEAGMPGFDFGAMFMFRGVHSSKFFLKEFHPTILSIDKFPVEGKDIFNIKTLFYSERLANDSLYAQWNPPYITSYYAVKINGKYKLTNAFPIIISGWKKYQLGYIDYFVHPAITFDKEKAQSALHFSKEIAKRFDLTLPDSITYVVASNVHEMSKLYNFDYQLSYSTGLTHTPLNTIVLSGPNFSHLHELVHILFQKEEWTKKGRPMIINEGLATFLAGSMGKGNFTEELITFSKEIRNVKDLTLSDIMQRKYAHKTDNIPIYVTGGFIFKLVQEKHGEKGMLKLFNCGRKKEDFQKVIEELFEMSFEKFNIWIIEELRNVTIGKEH